MVCTTYKKHGLSLCHIWFATKEEILLKIQNSEITADLVFAHGVHEKGMCDRGRKVYALCLSTQHSLIKILVNDSDAIYQTFGKHLRKFIQRSIAEGTTIRLASGREINDEVLNTCLRLYNKMKEDKGVPGEFNTTLARKYATEGNLLVSLARVNDAIVGFKASIVDDQNLRGWVSAFSFREEEFDAQVVSRAHQLLEWETMRYCCQHGITSYDFGGITSFENPNGIDKFKMNFAKEGQLISYDNYLVGVSLLGKLAVLGYTILKKLRK